MTSFSDISQLSDISGISRISRSGGTRCTGKADSLYTSEWHASATQGKNEGVTNPYTDPVDMEKVTRAFASCQNSISEHATLKLIYDCVEEASRNSNKVLSEGVAKKLRELLITHEVNKYLHLPNISKDSKEELTLLGITDLPQCNLSYEEKLDIKSRVESKLRERIHFFILTYENSGGNLKNLSKKDEYTVSKEAFEISETDLLHWKKEIEEVIAKYESDLLKCEELLDCWRNLKYGEMNAINTRRAEHLLLQAEVTKRQAEISRLSCTIRMFKETPVTIAAFKKLSTSLDERISAAREDVQKKEALKKAYKSLEGTEYDAILKKYLDLCKAIKKKEHLLELL